MENERRPQRMSAANRQQQLLEVALNVFSRRGFKGATTKEIAAAAGVAEAVIFQHFPSKEALYSAVLEMRLEASDEQRWIEEVTDSMRRNDDAAVFRSFILRILRAYRRDPSTQRVILFAALEGHEQGLVRMQKQFAPILDRFLDYIARRQKEGALADCSPDAVMIALGGVAHQYGQLTQLFPGAPLLEIADEEMARQFARILLRGVRRQGPARGRRGKQSRPGSPGSRKAK